MYRPKLLKPVSRITTARRHEKGRTREIVIVIAPPARVGFRLAGTRQTYWIDAEVGYEVAVKRFNLDVEKEAKKIKKEDSSGKIRINGARAKARKRLLNA